VLGLVREERKSIIYVADGLSSGGPVRMNSSVARIPDLPKIGVNGGRLGPLPPRDGMPGRPAGDFCHAERMRLTSLDFADRFRDLLKNARQANVSFYPISPKGLQGYSFTADGHADLQGAREGRRGSDSLLTLADNTDGLAVVNTNDLRGGLARIANDLQAYYVLGYYTTNRKWDGAVRSIKVRLKPKHDTIRARRQYRAPTEAEIAALSGAARPVAAAAPSPVEAALRALDRPAVEPATSSGSSGPIGSPTVYRILPRVPPQPVDVRQFGRTDRIRIEWPVAADVDRRIVRLLDRMGKPLPVEVPTVAGESGGPVIVELPLSAFAPGDYLIELRVVSATIETPSLLAFRVR